MVVTGEDASVPSIEGLRSRLLAAFDEHANVELDASALVTADLSLLQLIESARKFADAHDKTLRLTAPANAALCALLERSGFADGAAPEPCNFWLAKE